MIEISEDMDTAIHNLSEILGDYQGYLTNSTIAHIVLNLKISPPGLLIQGELISNYGVGNLHSKEYPMTGYSTSVPHSVYPIYSSMMSGGTTYRVTGLQLRDIIVSPLLRMSQGVDLAIDLAIKFLYLNLYSFYLQMLALTQQGQPISYTTVEIQDIITNIRWIAFQLECSSNPIGLYPLIELLRELDRTVSFIKSQSSSFFEYTL
jgi:hypothetical protein